MDNNLDKNKQEELENNLDQFLDQEEDKNSEKKVLKSNNGLVERVEKKLITNDGRELLI